MLEKLKIFDNTILKNLGEVFIKKLLNIIKSLTNTLQEVVDIIKLFDDQIFELKTEEIQKLNKENVLKVLLLWNDAISNLENDNEITAEFLTEIIQSITIKTNLKAKELFQSLRLVVLGKISGLDFIKIVPFMDLKSLKYRSKVVLDYIGTIS